MQCVTFSFPMRHSEMLCYIKSNDAVFYYGDQTSLKTRNVNAIDQCQSGQTHSVFFRCLLSTFCGEKNNNDSAYCIYR
jgi:hypothetical protein